MTFVKFANQLIKDLENSVSHLKKVYNFEHEYIFNTELEVIIIKGCTITDAELNSYTKVIYLNECYFYIEAKNQNGTNYFLLIIKKHNEHTKNQLQQEQKAY